MGSRPRRQVDGPDTQPSSGTPAGRRQPASQRSSPASRLGPEPRWCRGHALLVVLKHSGDFTGMVLARNLGEDSSGVHSQHRRLSAEHPAPQPGRPAESTFEAITRSVPWWSEPGQRGDRIRPFQRRSELRAPCVAVRPRRQKSRRSTRARLAASMGTREPRNGGGVQPDGPGSPSPLPARHILPEGARADDAESGRQLPATSRPVEVTERADRRHGLMLRPHRLSRTAPTMPLPNVLPN